MRKKKVHEIVVDYSKPLLREIVFVHVSATDGTTIECLLTRVPGIGEEIVREDKKYRILRVQHHEVDNDGRAAFGWHAFVDAELLPDEDEKPPKRKR